MAEDVLEKHATLSERQRAWRVVVACCSGAAITWAGWAYWVGRHFRDTIAAAEREMAHDRYATAARMLSELLARNPDSDETCYLLGVCEQRQGRNKAAADVLRG